MSCQERFLTTWPGFHSGHTKNSPNCYNVNMSDPSWAFWRTTQAIETQNNKQVVPSTSSNFNRLNNTFPAPCQPLLQFWSIVQIQPCASAHPRVGVENISAIPCSPRCCLGGVQLRVAHLSQLLHVSWKALGCLRQAWSRCTHAAVALW